MYEDSDDGSVELSDEEAEVMGEISAAAAMKAGNLGAQGTSAAFGD